ncbi:AER160Cp [Eremothecium gossypii ATCC 10895]|uniref:AER160Cp n=1 Tax=Eremothecium gossypii (strain ATCC 10895 / CBS 109.51 / FGSC 9923 / NRRL Y-1056) TaxID=284811 RepID=Q756U2_EREGS|nr:AER160Cp [Eremothecium gossypii ATCC 10895]AAS52842.1 AER160Cp [Eremothecium gossypii ATCC 10895]AEY97148.1 FAER160Cp [Eremothecium gossypii FDAG1]
MALHNYIYLKNKTHDQACHKLIARDHDPRPIMSKPAEGVTQEAQQSPCKTKPSKSGCTCTHPPERCSGSRAGDAKPNASDITW